MTPQLDLCGICHLRYKVLAKVETWARDAAYVKEVIGMPKQREHIIQS